MPASTVIVFEARSISRSARMRVSESTIAPSPAPGIWPPTSPVLPPCGTTGVAVSWQSLSTAATSCVEPGRTTQSALPWKRSRGSRKHPSMPAASVTTWFSPTIALKPAIIPGRAALCVAALFTLKIMPDFAEGNDKNRARLVAVTQKLREPRPDEGFALVMLKFYARLTSNLQNFPCHPASRRCTEEPRVVEAETGKRIVGRGVEDDKVQLMTFFEACRAFKETGDLPCHITFLIDAH